LLDRRAKLCIMNQFKMKKMEKDWFFFINNIFWETRVKDGYRILSIPRFDMQTSLKGVSKLFINEGTVYFGYLSEIDRYFIGTKYTDSGPFPDNEETRAVLHTFIWFPEDLDTKNIATIPHNWDKQLFEFLLNARNKFYDIPLNVKVIEDVQMYLKDTAPLLLDDKVISWIDLGEIQLLSPQKTLKKPESTQYSSKKKAEMRQQTPMTGAISGGILGGLLGRILGGFLTSGAGIIVGGIIGAKIEEEIRKKMTDEEAE